MQIDRVAATAPLAAAPAPANQRSDSPNSYKLPSLPLPHISRPQPSFPKVWTAAPPSALTGRAQELWTTDRQQQNPPSHRHRNPPPPTSNRPPPALCTAASLATSEQRPPRHRLRPRLRGETRDPSIFPCNPQLFFRKASLDLTSPPTKTTRSQPFHLCLFLCTLPPTCSANRARLAALPRVALHCPFGATGRWHRNWFD
jgi:hypothetical protein